MYFGGLIPQTAKASLAERCVACKFKVFLVCSLARTTESLGVRATAVQPKRKRHNRNGYVFFVVGGGGFEPPKSETSDLQSDAFGHSAIRPYICLYYWCCGAGDWNRTRNLLITNQLLCQLSYTSKRQILCGALGWNRTADIWIFSPPLYRLSYQGIFKRLLMGA